MITSMSHQDDLQAALVDLLVSLKADPAVPIGLYEVGPLGTGVQAGGQCFVQGGARSGRRAPMQQLARSPSSFGTRLQLTKAGDVLLTPVIDQFSYGHLLSTTTKIIHRSLFAAERRF